jgi:hypothetical protein
VGLLVEVLRERRHRLQCISEQQRHGEPQSQIAVQVRDVSDDSALPCTTSDRLRRNP